MFPTTQTRLKTTLRRSIDAAIDFATLGEYGLASAWEDPAAAAGSGTPRARQDTPNLTWRAGAPATSAATAAGTAIGPSVGVPAGTATLAPPSGPRRTPGAATPPPQGPRRAPAKLQPASAAARALIEQNRRVERATAPYCAGQPLRGRALEPTLPQSARHREGMAPREQRCVSDAA